MHTNRRAILSTVFTALALGLGVGPAPAQTHGEAEHFTAVAVVNNNLGSGAGTVLIDINRWSTDAERALLLKTLQQEGSETLLNELRDTKAVGRIRTPDSLGYDLHYAHQRPLEDGGRRIVIATDRPISFWEAHYRPRTLDYPFTIIQMDIGPDGTGRGTMSVATKVRALGNNTVELENFASSPVMLTEIRAEKKR
jgi:hypothetical protein